MLLLLTGCSKTLNLPQGVYVFPRPTALWVSETCGDLLLTKEDERGLGFFADTYEQLGMDNMCVYPDPAILEHEQRHKKMAAEGLPPEVEHLRMLTETDKLI